MPLCSKKIRAVEGPILAVTQGISRMDIEGGGAQTSQPDRGQETPSATARNADGDEDDDE